MPEEPAQQQLLDCFAGYVSPQKVSMYRMWGVDCIPGRREGVRVWDHDGRRTWIDCRSAGGGDPAPTWHARRSPSSPRPSRPDRSAPS